MYITVNGVKLYYETLGEGSPLILLHGNGEDMHIFDSLAKPLSKNFKLYMVDSRNHGKSEATADYSYSTMAEDIYSFINALQLEKPKILGFSDGAIIAVSLELMYPGSTGHMALLGINLKPEDFKDEILIELQQEYKTAPNPLLKLMLTEPDISPGDLGKIKNPCLVIAGQNDIFKPETFETVSKHLPNSELLILPDETHDSYIAGNDMLYLRLLDFFGKVR